MSEHQHQLNIFSAKLTQYFNHVAKLFRFQCALRVDSGFILNEAQ